MAVLNVSVVAADHEVWSGEASMVVAKTVEGEIGILPGHEPLLAILASGEVRVTLHGGESIKAQADDGFLSVENNTVHGRRASGRAGLSWPTHRGTDRSTVRGPQRPALIAMAGLPGSGKSTLAEIIGARIGATIVSVDPIESSILNAGIDSDQPTGLAAYLVAETIAEQVLLAGALGHRRCSERRRARTAAMARPGRPLRASSCESSRWSVPTKNCTRSGSRNVESCRTDGCTRVEQSVEEYADWKGACAVASAGDDRHASAPIGENVEIALAFLEALAC